jgi:S1-C subfamily serine protease
LSTRRHPTPARLVAALTVLLALPLLATAGPAAGASKGMRTQAAAAPASDVLAGLGDLGDLLARLLGQAAPSAPPSLVSRVAASTVKVSSTACGVRLSGSGFSTGPDTIVTNAHVVAGATATTVQRPDGRVLPAQVQVFDPVRDLALLAVPGLGQPSLALGSAVVGEDAAVFGHPGGRTALEVSPAVVLRKVVVDLEDIYEQTSSPRQILVLNARLAPGDSGGPLVNSAGQVVGVAFAVANLRRATAFAVASEELVPVLAQPRNGPVSTGRCIV